MGGGVPSDLAGLSAGHKVASVVEEVAENIRGKSTGFSRSSRCSRCYWIGGEEAAVCTDDQYATLQGVGKGCEFRGSGVRAGLAHLLEMKHSRYSLVGAFLSQLLQVRMLFKPVASQPTELYGSCV